MADDDLEAMSLRIREFILKHLLEGEEDVNLTDDTPLVSGGVIDSMNAMKLGLFLEKSFDVKIRPEDLVETENFETVGSIAALVAAKRRG